MALGHSPAGHAVPGRACRHATRYRGLFTQHQVLRPPPEELHPSAAIGTGGDPEAAAGWNRLIGTFIRRARKPSPGGRHEHWHPIGTPGNHELVARGVVPGAERLRAAFGLSQGPGRHRRDTVRAGAVLQRRQGRGVRNAPPAAKTNIRNEIIFARMRAYDITFADFEKRLYGDGNAVTLGSDLAGLILAGLTATTGNAATKSVLGAASAGVIGAKAAIDKDLYYQKTIPALLAQMEADRLQAKAPIVTGMKVPDEQ